MNHENDADPDEAPTTAGHPPRRRHVDSLPGPRPDSFPAALGPPSPAVKPPSEETPAAEVSVSPGSVYITVELPGAPKDSLDIQATDRTLHVVAPRVGAATYRLEVALPVRVDPSSAKATYRNGTLDVALRRTHPSGGERGEV